MSHPALKAVIASRKHPGIYVIRKRIIRSKMNFSKRLSKRIFKEIKKPLSSKKAAKGIEVPSQAIK